MFNYTTLFPNFLSEMTVFHNLALMVAYTILLGSFVLTAHSATEGGKVLMHIYKYAALIAAIVASPAIAQQFSDGIWQISNSMEANIGQTIYNDINQDLQNQNGNSTTGSGSGSGSGGYLAYFTGVNISPTAILAMILDAACICLAFVCMVIIWVIYLFQFGFASVMEAFLPIAIACLATQGWSGWGIRWITTMIGIFCWPLGMTIVLIGTLNLLTTPGLLNSFTQGGALQVSQGFLAKLAFASVYTIVGLCVAPAAISKIADSGGSVGSALASGGMQLGTQIAGVASGMASGGGGAGGSEGGGKPSSGDQSSAPDRPKPNNIPEVSTSGSSGDSPAPPSKPRIRVGPSQADEEDLNPVMN